MKRNKIKDFAKNPNKALFKLAMPVVIGMVVQTMYNIVDTAFVGRIGTEAIAALTFSFPLFFLLIALESGIGAGMGSRISRFLGEKKKGGAENAAMHGLLLSIIASVVVFLLGRLSLKPLFLLFGATGIVLDMAIDYMSIILVGVFFMFPSYTIFNMLSSQGDTKSPMKIQITSLLLNVFLDWLFIFKFGLGIKGAALATSISFFASLVISTYYVRKVSYLHIHRSSFKFSPWILKQILYVGGPATLMMFLMSGYVIFLNRALVSFGVNYVAMFGMVIRVESVAMMPIVGFSLANMTLVGMFFGARRYDLLRNVTLFALRTCLWITFVLGSLFYIFSSHLLKIFTNDISLINLGIPYLRLDVFTLPLMAVSIILSRAMQGMGYGAPGLVINLVRVFIVAIPLAFWFVFGLGLGYLSIAVAMIVGGIVGNIVAFVWFNSKLRKHGF